MGYVVEIENWHQDKIHFKSGVTLYQETWVEHQEKVTLKGVVAFHPIDGGANGIRKGDTILFRYDVVGDAYIDEFDRRIYNNQLFIGGKIYWNVGSNQVLAIDHKEGGIRAFGSYVIGRQTEKKRNWTSSILVAAKDFEEEIDTDVLEVVYPGDGVEVGQKWICRHDYLQRYNFENVVGDEVVAIKKNYLIAQINSN